MSKTEVMKKQGHVIDSNKSVKDNPIKLMDFLLKHSKGHYD
ncbi:hypothetical protein V6B33_06080 [Mangrovibacillus sp. Mu-81]